MSPDGRSKAHATRSAVSVGSAAGRLTGTRGTSKVRVEHSQDIDVPSRSPPRPRGLKSITHGTSKAAADHFQDIESSSRSPPRPRRLPSITAKGGVTCLGLGKPRVPVSRPAAEPTETAERVA